MEERAVGQEDMEGPILDKSKFLARLPRIALRIPKQQSHVVAKILSKHVLDMPRVRHIVPDPSDASKRLVVLSEDISEPSLEGLPEEGWQSKRWYLWMLCTMRLSWTTPIGLWVPVGMGGAEHILREILPTGCEVPSSFETIGHIAHLNLWDDLLPYKKVIATVILDKNPKLKTVVNKVGTITNDFRVAEFEVLAGNPSLVTEIKQHGATFRLDFGMVYWNSRLEGEHKRLFAQFKPGQVIVDMFAGIGPFAIPAAQQGCVVYANDLNPASVKYLKINSEINKLGESVKPFNMDARDFVRELVTARPGQVTAEGGKECKYTTDEDRPGTNGDEHITNICGRESYTGNEDVKGNCTGEAREITEPALSWPADAGSDLPKTKKGGGGKGTSTKRAGPTRMSFMEAKPWEHFDHVVMNLPASALEFLDVLNGLLSKERWKGTMPRVHCYCFMRSKETTADIIKKAEGYLGGSIHDPEVYTVRDVAPNKIMVCVSFDLPQDVAFATPPTSVTTLERSSEDESSLKRPRTK